MSRKKQAEKAEFMLFDVVYEDGSLSSNRRVPNAALGGLGGPDGDAPARGIIEAQDREIAQRSGKPRSPIKSLNRGNKRKAGIEAAKPRYAAN